MLKSILAVLLLAVIFSGCSSHPVLPEKSDIKVSRDNPSDKCKNLGAIEGRSRKVNAKPEDALEDLKEEAIRKGADYVRIETMGAQSATIRGTAFFCN
jgi:PBP1b-binding outer membrane lipoprotein LpoB